MVELVCPCRVVPQGLFLNINKNIFMNIQDYTPQYVDKKFNGKAEFDKWLKETTKYIVTFDDRGQDLLQFHIAENMEVIHVELPNLAHIYTGSVVTNGEPQELAMLQIYNPNFKETSYLKYQIDKVEIF